MFYRNVNLCDYRHINEEENSAEELNKYIILILKILKKNFINFTTLLNHTNIQQK